jgi:hypothetical protein
MNEFHLLLKEGNKFTNFERYWQTKIQIQDESKLIFFIFERPTTFTIINTISSKN